MANEWNRRYKSEETASMTKLFFPNALEARKVVRDMEHDNYTTRLMTGHGGFCSYLDQFKGGDNPSCQCEPDKEEAVIQLILECPVFAKLRLDTQYLLNIDLIVENLPYIKNGIDTRNIILDYSKKII